MLLVHAHAQATPTDAHDDGVDRPLTEAEIAELVRETLPVVGHLVREVMNRIPPHVNRDDLASAGMYALVAAAKSFRAERGVPFARFATIRIRGALTDELRGMDWVSRGARSRVRELTKVRADLAQQLGREPSGEELCHACGLSTAELQAIEADADRGTVLSLQGLAADGGLDPLAARDDGPESLLLRRETIGYVRDAVAELPERLQTVVVGYFYEHRKMADIAVELGVSESRVSQMRSEALRVLQIAMEAVDGESPTGVPAGRRPRAANAAYVAAVAARSTLAARLAASTVLGESRAELGSLQAG